MQTQITTVKKISLTLAASAACLFTFGSPAQACSGPQKPTPIAALAPSMSAMMRLGIVPRPKAGPDAARPEDAPQAETATSLIHTIVGLWDTQYLVAGQMVDRGYEVYHSDGTEILVDIAPPATDNVCIGVWTQPTPTTFKLTHPSWTFDLSGNLTGTAMIRNNITLGKDGQSFTGTFTVDIYDLNSTLQAHFAGQLAGARINP